MFCIISTSDLEHLGGTLGGEGLCYRNDGGQDRHQDPVHHTPHHGDVVPITIKKKHRLYQLPGQLLPLNL